MPETRRRGKTDWRSSARSAPGVPTALKALGRRIRELRKLRELTQEAAAEKARLDSKHLSDIERAVTNPTLATLVGIARALNVKLGDLFPDRKLDDEL